MSLVVVLSGCAARAKPVAVGPSVTDAGRRVAVERGGTRATVTVDAWKYDPRDLDRTLLPFFLVVENTTSGPVRLPLERVTLTDSTRRQWSLLTPEQAHHLALSGRGGWGGGPLFSIGVGGGSGGVGGGVGVGVPVGGGSSAYAEVLTRAFRGGEIAAGRRMEGFLYFPRLDQDVARFTLTLSPDGQDELSLEFAMEKR
ncbi:MAG: hypothetical protein AUH29_03715 [Candidatus Rokubacteria bacterium 13_1_40CM_69_27]|nr:MAG: hypothetical protein AUH29_03715 [Candidatus Rokubacteria bacterium 13_1_40CM_69_27]